MRRQMLGVTVEAASAATIEKTRSVVTDGSGHYRFVERRPDSYSATFSLEGFQSFTRDAPDLPAQFTMTINADMKVGSLEETLTVTGDAVQSDFNDAMNEEVSDQRSGMGAETSSGGAGEVVSLTGS